MSKRRLTARDYKSVQRSGFDWRRWRELGIGLGAGLLVALVVYVSDHRGAEALPERAASTHRAGAGAAAEAAGAARATGAVAGSGRAPAHPGAGDGETNYAFYDMLPKFEVVVPEREHGAHVDAAARVERPGTYFLQIGSYRNAADAERIRAQLARQDISANVQRVALDADVWYRIRVGPLKDLNQLNRLRQRLQAADLDSLVIRVED